MSCHTSIKPHTQMVYIQYEGIYMVICLSYFRKASYTGGLYTVWRYIYGNMSCLTFAHKASYIDDLYTVCYYKHSFEVR